MPCFKKRLRNFDKGDNGYLGKDQYGFHRESGIRKTIGAMRIICKMNLECDREYNIRFGDFEKTFNIQNGIA